MRKSDLDRALGPTPPVFADRVAQTLLTLKEEPPVKAKHVRRTLVFALVTLLLIGAACALVITQGQDWYYHNRFTAYQENEPEKQQAILDNLTTDIPQTQTETDLVTVTVQDASWVPEEGVATLSLAVQALHPDEDELYSILDLDEDACWSDTPDPDDPDSRTEHWLWTDKGYGPPEEMMDDPAKRLLFLDGGEIYIGADGTQEMPIYCTDQFRGENGAAIFVLEFDLTRLDEEKVTEEYACETFDPSWGLAEDEWTRSHEESLRQSLDYAKAAGAAIEANTDENGMLTLRYEYDVEPFADNELLSDQAVHGAAVFRIKVK